MVRFIPSANTTVNRLRNVSPGEIQDTLQAYCESKTGLKFSPVWNDEGAGSETLDHHASSPDGNHGRDCRLLNWPRW